MIVKLSLWLHVVDTVHSLIIWLHPYTLFCIVMSSCCTDLPLLVESAAICTFVDVNHRGRMTANGLNIMGGSDITNSVYAC